MAKELNCSDNQCSPSTRNWIDLSEEEQFQPYRLNRDAQPTVGEFQLLGDSIFVRFSAKCLDQPSTLIDGHPAIGYCVSGQRIYQLTQRIINGEYALKKSVLILIGTNDILCRRSLPLMIQQYQQLLDCLRYRGASKFVLLTVPPIPKLALTKWHWETICGFNSFLNGLENAAMKIRVIDLSNLFIKLYSPLLASPARISHLKRKSQSYDEDLLDSDTPKKKKLFLPCDTEEDDAKLSPFGRYLNKVNREENLLKDDDGDGYPCYQQKAFIDYYFWTCLKKELCLSSPKPERLLSPKSPNCEESANPKKITEVKDMFKTWTDRRFELVTETCVTPPPYRRSSISSPDIEDGGKSPSVTITEQNIIDYTQHFLRLDYYEKFYYGGRMDMIHPNYDGMQRIFELLKNSRIL